MTLRCLTLRPSVRGCRWGGDRARGEAKPPRARSRPGGGDGAGQGLGCGGEPDIGGEMRPRYPLWEHP
jgi:hypothetical protein